jgi:AcrR family transcriptional regulator
MQTVGAARPRESESAATRRAILDAAEALLAAGGEDGLSIRDLCARAGVTAPTVYHHFGDKAQLVERVVDECFADFDRAFVGRAAPSDPVEALRWAFDRYVDYGQRHPAHYRLMFQPRRAHRTHGGLASYDGLRRRVASIAATGRLVVEVEDAAAAFWASVHGVTSLLVSGFVPRDAPMVALVRDSMITQLTVPAAARRDGAPGGNATRSKRRKRA